MSRAATSKTPDRVQRSPGMPLSVLIADDHAIFRSRARVLVESAGYDVVGEAHDGADTIAKVKSLDPDIVLLDIQLPDQDGFAIAAELARESRPPRVVLISSREAEDYGSRLAAATVSGFVHKPDLSRTSLERLVGGPRRSSG